MSMVGSLFAPVSRLLTDIMRPFIDKHDSYVSNSKAVIRKLKNLDVSHGFFVSFDVVSLFTNVPIVETLDVCLLSADSTLADRTSLSVDEILVLSHIVLTSSYF